MDTPWEPRNALFSPPQRPRELILAELEAAKKRLPPVPESDRRGDPKWLLLLSALALPWVIILAAVGGVAVAIFSILR